MKKKEKTPPTPTQESSFSLKEYFTLHFDVFQSFWFHLESDADVLKYQQGS